MLPEFSLVKYQITERWVEWDVIFEDMPEQPMRCTSGELYSQKAFGKKVMVFRDMVPQLMLKSSWRNLLDTKVRTAKVGGTGHG
jgi:hypothetical protein